jgi:hypothetical protein
MNNEYHNASELIKNLSGTNNKEWCVCRFVSGVNDKPPTFGWPLTFLKAGNILGDDLGWSESGQLATFTKEEAEKIANKTKHNIAVDCPVHISEIEWTVRAYSHYDGSSCIMYSGRDYIQAEKELALGLLIKERNHKLYLKVELQGKVSAK